jgi:hypothetical protein
MYMTHVICRIRVHIRAATLALRFGSRYGRTYIYQGQVGR